MKDLKSIKLLVIDVDGTMTDAGIYYDEHGNELKKFCTKDAAGFFAARAVGIQSIKLLVIDVDGTMTDAGIYYDEHGNELKKFCTKDAAGFFAARAVGIQTMVLKRWCSPEGSAKRLSGG